MIENPESKVQSGGAGSTDRQTDRERDGTPCFPDRWSPAPRHTMRRYGTYIRWRCHGVLLLCLAAALRFAPVAPHPQCLDFKPPFRPQQELQFCTAYKEFGCCDYAKDQDLMTRFYRIMGHFDYHGYANCASYVQDLLCQVGRCVHGQRSISALLR